MHAEISQHPNTMGDDLSPRPLGAVRAGCLSYAKMLYKVASISLCMLCSPLVPSHDRRKGTEDCPAPMAGRSKYKSGLP